MWWEVDAHCTSIFFLIFSVLKSEKLDFSVNVNVQDLQKALNSNFAYKEHGGKSMHI